jgi:uncharacterized protein with PIN domain
MKKEIIPHKCNKCSKELYRMESKDLVKNGIPHKNFIFHKNKYWCKECWC